MTSSEFVPLLIAAFPEFPDHHAELEDETTRGLVHVEMGTFAEFAQRAKGRGDWEVYTRIMRLADQVLREADEALDNALHVSFLEHIDFNGPRGQDAWSHLSPQQQRV